jgi:hypothetical protein
MIGISKIKLSAQEATKTTKNSLRYDIFKLLIAWNFDFSRIP